MWFFFWEEGCYLWCYLHVILYKVGNMLYAYVTKALQLYWSWANNKILNNYLHFYFTIRL